jgi:glucose uptake protein
MNARKQEWLFTLLAATIFNFGNMLMLGAVSVAGMTVAVPLSLGVAMIVGSWMKYLGQGEMNTALLLAGTLLILISAILDSVAYSHMRGLQHEALARAGKTKSTRRPSSLKGLILAVVAGIVLGTFGPLLARAQDPEDGVGPYSLLFLFGVAVVFSTFVFNLFFMNLPIEGEPLEIADYLKIAVKNHVLGWLAGVVWAVGAIALFVANSPKGDTHPAGLVSTLQLAAPIVAGLWGLLYCKEFKTGDFRVKILGAMMLVLFAGGWAFFSFAALSAAKP